MCRKLLPLLILSTLSELSFDPILTPPTIVKMSATVASSRIALRTLSIGWLGSKAFCLLRAQIVSLEWYRNRGHTHTVPRKPIVAISRGDNPEVSKIVSTISRFALGFDVCSEMMCVTEPAIRTEAGVNRDILSGIRIYILIERIKR